MPIISHSPKHSLTYRGCGVDGGWGVYKDVAHDGWLVVTVLRQAVRVCPVVDGQVMTVSVDRRAVIKVNLSIYLKI